MARAARRLPSDSIETKTPSGVGCMRSMPLASPGWSVSPFQDGLRDSRRSNNPNSRRRCAVRLPTPPSLGSVRAQNFSLREAVIALEELVHSHAGAEQLMCFITAYSSRQTPQELWQLIKTWS